jgi:hypothetical protein
VAHHFHDNCYQFAELSFAFFIFAFNNVEMQRHRNSTCVHSTIGAALLDLVVFSFFFLKALLLLPAAG